MKKNYLLLVLFLSLGDFSFANNIADKNFEIVFENVEIPEACCTVGTVTVCGDNSKPLCAFAREVYCKMNACTEQTIEENDKILSDYNKKQQLSLTQP